MKKITGLKRQITESQLSPPGLIVTPDWLVQMLDQPALRLLDVRPQESYEEGHIPGAVQVDLAALTCPVDDVPGILLPPESFEMQMSRLGIDRTKTVVIYDDNWGMPAARILWSLTRYGHLNAAVLTGGSDRWQEEGRPWTTEPFSPPLAKFVVQPHDHHSAAHTWLLHQLDREDLVLLDTRSPSEYSQGHLPGAICWDWVEGVPLTGWDTMRPADELLAELSDLGITPDKEIITYCHSGVRAAHTYLLLRNLGYPRVRLYDGSWLEWSTRVMKEVSVDHKT